MGFEPTETLLPHKLSRRAHSTTLPPARLCKFVVICRTSGKLDVMEAGGNSFFWACEMMWS